MNIKHFFRPGFWLILLFIIGLSLTAVPLPIAHAATITVNTTNDENNSDGDCSLREAIIAANTDTAVDACPAGNGADTITLPAGTYLLSLAGADEDDALTGDLDITNDLTITGAGPALTIIDGNGLDRVFHLHTLANPATIASLTIRGGDSGIYAGSGLFLSGGNLTLLNSRVRDNSSSSGIYALGATLTVINSRIYQNSSKGLVINGTASATLINSLVSGNSTTFDGAGITNGGTLTLINSTVSGNSALSNGGGIWNNGGTTTLYNTTITNNTADEDGDETGDGGGLYISSGTLTIWNSIIAGNFDDSSSTRHSDCSGTLTSQGYNLIQSATGCTITGDTTGNATGVIPYLSPLADNGGPTLTHAIFLAGSAAVDGGNPAGCEDADGAPLTTDQRGYLRPVDGGSGTARCDMGAFEFNAPPPPATLVVERTSDASDSNPGDGICDISVNVGDQCGLRAALEEANALGTAAGPHLIEFDISGSGPHTFTPASPLPEISVPVIINGESQPGALCPTNNTPATLQLVLDGSSAGDTAGLVLANGSDGSAIRGLVVGHFQREGIVLLSDDNQLSCNHIGLAADGLSAMGNDLAGIRINATGNTIGGLTSHSQRNVISANGTQGVRVAAGAFNSIQNNFVGTTADGLSALGNTAGIAILTDSTLVGVIPAQLRGTRIDLARNVISGNSGLGIQVNGGNSTLIMGNLIGLARDGLTPLGNGGNGIQIVGESVHTFVGDPRPTLANHIAHNGGSGVILNINNGTPIQNPIRGNAIFDNGNLGISLGTDGVDINDPGDGDSGENERQNYPVLQTTPGSLSVNVTLDSQANTQYTIDFYRSDSCDPMGHGEGREYLTTALVLTNSTGHGDFTTLLNSASPGDTITATATDPNNNTSEFSACVQFDPQITPTASATEGPSPTPTHTSTPGPSPTPTATATDGPSPTPTHTATPGPSPTPTPTLDPSADPTHHLYLPGVIHSNP